MNDDYENALVDFVNFVKTLRVNAHSLLMRSRACETFEDRIDREIRKLEKQVKQKLKEFDEVLDETSDTWKKQLCRNVGNKVCSVGKFFGKKEIEQGESEEGRTDRSQTSCFEESCPGESIDSCKDRPERFFDALNANTPTVGCKKSECEIHLKK